MDEKSEIISKIMIKIIKTKQGMHASAKFHH